MMMEEMMKTTVRSAPDGSDNDPALDLGCVSFFIAALSHHKLGDQYHCYQHSKHLFNQCYPSLLSPNKRD